MSEEKNMSSNPSAPAPASQADLEQLRAEMIEMRDEAKRMRDEAAQMKAEIPDRPERCW